MDSWRSEMEKTSWVIICKPQGMKCHKKKARLAAGFLQIENSDHQEVAEDGIT